MREYRTPFSGDIISIQCDCGGDVEPLGYISSIAKYRHVCTKCKKILHLDREYPYFANIKMETGDDGR